MTAQLVMLDQEGSGATFSDDRRFRYLLWRIWSPAQPIVHFCMLNPSVADEEVLDPTLRRCAGFARQWAMGGMLITNLWPLVSTDPRALLLTQDKDGQKDAGGFWPLNESYIANAAKRAEFTVVGWGSNAVRAVIEMSVPHVYHSLLKPYGPVKCLRTTRTGQPGHPLYLPYDCELKDWAP